jgi:hypothetical protein
MPGLYGQQNGSWLPQFGNGNWVGSWGARPADFGNNQNAYSYFQQNPGQMQNYNQGRLGNAFTSWFGGGAQQGPVSNPNQPPRPPVTPIQSQIGQAPTNQDPMGGGDVPNIYSPYTPPITQTVKPGMLGNYGQPNTQQANIPQMGQPQYPNNKFATNGNIGDFRGRGWF